MTTTEEIMFNPVGVIESKLHIWTEAEMVEVETPPSAEIISINSIAERAESGSRRGRWPKVRSSEREPIVWPVRLAVAKRDEFSCRKCHHPHNEYRKFEIDHIIPWSAGGSDRSTNLRFLCQSCNQDRSNFIDGTETRPVWPVTWWCVECWGPDAFFRNYIGKGELFCMDIAHRVYEGHVRAYCAQCEHLSWTDVTL